MKNEEGFTLIEMLVVILIISVLLILMVSNLSGVNDKISETKNEGIIQTIESQQVIYEMQEGKKPTIDDLVNGKFITVKQKDAYEEAIKNTGN